MNKVSFKICFMLINFVIYAKNFYINAKIMPDKYVALGFCERVFYVSPTHGAKRHKHIDPTNSLNQPCLAGLKICSKRPCKIGGYFDQQDQT